MPPASETAEESSLFDRRYLCHEGDDVSLIGQPLPRQEDPRLLRGKGSYVADLAPAHTLHMAVLRSPHAHARMLGRDFTQATRLPGVACVLTADDVASLTPLPVMIQ